MNLVEQSENVANHDIPWQVREQGRTGEGGGGGEG